VGQAHLAGLWKTLTADQACIRYGVVGRWEKPGNHKRLCGVCICPGEGGIVEWTEEMKRLLDEYDPNLSEGTSKGVVANLMIQDLTPIFRLLADIGSSS
jgi:hypothetical protein